MSVITFSSKNINIQTETKAKNEHLPKCLTTLIIPFLQAHELAVCCRVNKYWHVQGSKDVHWKKLSRMLNIPEGVSVQQYLNEHGMKSKEMIAKCFIDLAANVPMNHIVDFNCSLPLNPIPEQCYLEGTLQIGNGDAALQIGNGDGDRVFTRERKYYLLSAKFPGQFNFKDRRNFEFDLHNFHFYYDDPQMRIKELSVCYKFNFKGRLPAINEKWVDELSAEMFSALRKRGNCLDLQQQKIIKDRNQYHKDRNQYHKQCRLVIVIVAVAYVVLKSFTFS